MILVSLLIIKKANKVEKIMKELNKKVFNK